MDPAILVRMARQNSLTRTRCFGLPIPSLETVARDNISGMLLVYRRKKMVRSWFVGFATVVAAIVSSAAIPAYASHVLITEEEAKLPPPRGAVATDRRGVTRGPKIKYVEESEPIHSPMHLQLTFESFGGAKIDPDSVKATYLRIPNVDLTPRIKSFVQATGIDIPDLQLPAGDHTVRVAGKDLDGVLGMPHFILRAPPCT